MKNLVFFITVLCVTMTSKAQINEIGLLLGGSNYIGDIGPENYINPNEFMGGLIYKWNVNPRIAFRGSFTLTTLSSDDADATNGERLDRGIHFSNGIKEIAFGLEFNYLEYNLDDYRQTHTPYLIVEVAAFNYKVATRQTGPEQYNYEAKTSIAIPFGLGYKTKLFYDFAIAFEIRARYTFVDDLDYNNPSIPNLNFGNPNSNDWYVLSGFSIVYTFGRPACYTTPY